MAKAQLVQVNFAISVVVIGAVAAFAAYLIISANRAATAEGYGSDMPQQQTGEVPRLGEELRKVNPLPGEQGHE